jgi:hypothetical protein
MTISMDEKEQPLLAPRQGPYKFIFRNKPLSIPRRREIFIREIHNSALNGHFRIDKT